MMVCKALLEPLMAWEHSSVQSSSHTGIFYLFMWMFWDGTVSKQVPCKGCRFPTLSQVKSGKKISLSSEYNGHSKMSLSSLGWLTQ